MHNISCNKVADLMEEYCLFVLVIALTAKASFRHTFTLH